MKAKQMVMIVASFFLLCTLIALQFVVTPNPVQAHPNVGITITPTSNPTVVATPDTSDPPPEPVIPIQLGCNLICGTDGQPLQANIDIQLIHPESGWIEAATISNQQQTNVPVPYEGEWEVHIVNQPRYASTGDISPVAIPQMIDKVWTNSGLQVVSCPVNCLPAPGDLPQTGADLSGQSTPMPLDWGQLAAILLTCVLALLLVYRYYRRIRSNLLRPLDR